MHASFNTFTVRAAQLSEKPLLQDIAARALGMFGPHTVKVEIYDEDFTPALNAEPEAGFVSVAENAQGIAGYCQMTSYPDYLRLHHVFVDPHFNRKGAGSAILQDVFMRAAQLEFKTIGLLTSAQAPWSVPFYTRHGFVIPKQDSEMPVGLLNDQILAQYSDLVTQIPGYLPVTAMVKTLAP